MMRDMASIYYKMSDQQLYQLRSKKLRQIQKLEGMNRGVHMNRDLRELRKQVDWIEAVQASRKLQERLF